MVLNEYRTLYLPRFDIDNCVDRLALVKVGKITWKGEKLGGRFEKHIVVLVSFIYRRLQHYKHIIF